MRYSLPIISALFTAAARVNGGRPYRDDESREMVKMYELTEVEQSYVVFVGSLAKAKLKSNAVLMYFFFYTWKTNTHVLVIAIRKDRKK